MASVSAATPLLVFQMAGQGFALGLEHVRGVVAAVEITPLPGAPAGVLGFFDLRGELVPVLDGFADGANRARGLGVDDRFVLVDTGGRVVALVAQAVAGVEHVVVEPLARMDGAELGDAPFVGVCRAADELLLVRDVARFLSAAQRMVLDEALAEVLR